MTTALDYCTKIPKYQIWLVGHPVPKEFQLDIYEGSVKVKLGYNFGKKNQILDIFFKKLFFLIKNFRLKRLQLRSVLFLLCTDVTAFICSAEFGAEDMDTGADIDSSEAKVNISNCGLKSKFSSH